jgi:hypothetical protein
MSSVTATRGVWLPEGRRHVARPLELSAVLVTGSLVAMPVWIERGALGAAVVLAATLGLTLAASLTSLRATVIATALLLAPPGVIGENSAIRASIALVVVLALLASSRTSVSEPGLEPVVTFLLLAISVLFCVAGVLSGYTLHVALSMALLYGLAGATVLISPQHDPAVVDALRALAILLGVAVLSYAVSWALGFRLGGDIVAGPNREVTAYFPATLTQGARGSLFELPRFSVFSGEPGLGAVMLLFGLWSALRLFQGRLRLGLAGLLIAGGLLTQSTAFLITVIALGVVAAALALRERRGVTVAVIALATLAVPALLVASQLLAQKKASDPLSLSDRGFGQTHAVGEINLVSLLTAKPTIAIAFLVFGVVLIRAAWPRAWDVGLIAAVFLTGLFAQPLHLHPGTWLLLSLTAVTAGRVADRSRRRE